MQTRITIRFEVDKELGNELGKAYPLFGGQAFQEHTFTLKGDDLQQHLPLLLPFAERLGMALCGERGKEDRREVPAERLLSVMSHMQLLQNGTYCYRKRSFISGMQFGKSCR